MKPYKRYFTESEDLINTPEFKKWFSGSKVIKDGKPLIVYHGTNNNFTSFKLSNTISKEGGRKYGKGIYFSGDKDQARVFGNTIKQAYLSIKNPIHDKPKDFYAKNHNIPLPTFGSSKEVFSVYDSIKESDVQKYLKNKKIDGVIIKNGYMGDEYVVFKPSQIRIVDA